MDFLRQIKLEIRKTLKTKSLLFTGIFVLVVAMAIPIIGFTVERLREDRYYMGGMTSVVNVGYEVSMGYPRGEGEEPIIIDGITIEADNPFYWDIWELNYEREDIESGRGRFSDSEVLNLTLEVIDHEAAFYAKLAKHIKESRDYRRDLVWAGMDSIYSKFIYENIDKDDDKLFEAISYKMGIDREIFNEQYINISEEEREKNLNEADEKLDILFSVVEKDDFPQYVDLKIEHERDRIESLEEQISIQEQIIIENPSQESNINHHIEDLRREIEIIKTSHIPTLEYRLEKNIIPGEDMWQNMALSDIEQNRNNIIHTEAITEEEFNRHRSYREQHGSYAEYLDHIQFRIDGYNNEILKAQSSLDAGNPDMAYIPNGARYKTVDFLGYSVFVSLYAVLIGAWIIASEFQQGTIRLLLIRPKTRTKILMAKFLASLSIVLTIYISGSLLNMVTNGALYGFSDFGYPNYTISGEVNFLSYYIPKMLACIIPIIFGYAVALMISVLIKNIAFSIIIPIVCLIGSNIALDILAHSKKFDWIAYTPIPYVQMSSFFTRYSSVQYAMEHGLELSLPYGVTLLLVLSIICTLVSILAFKNRDITH